jgi:hypothetical protein
MIKDHNESATIAKVMVVGFQAFAEICGVDSVLLSLSMAVRSLIDPIGSEEDKWNSQRNRRNS